MVTSFDLPNSQEQSYFRMSKIFNILLLWGNNLILIIAFYYQFARHELPCPICLLQRVGIILISIGFFLNVNFEIKATHYGVALIGCVLTTIIAMRQVLLHITPGDPGYGSSLFGLHFYSLAILSSVVTIVSIAFLLGFYDWEKSRKLNTCKLVTKSAKSAMIVLSILIFVNLISTFLECGVGKCVSNPIYYQLLKK
ncbi:MAG: disulfide bond formation protein B [Candidatus Dasytiphilus stammeri]